MRYLCAPLVLLCLATPLSAEWLIDLETGLASVGSCDFRIPGNTGTEVSLTDDFDVDSIVFSRYRVSYLPTPDHTWSVLVAPLEFSGTGVVGSDVDFNDVTFPAGSSLRATYKFNSYRLTYRRNYHTDQPFSYGLGATLKVRDAAIGLSGNGLSSRYEDLGLVPLLSFFAQWQFADRAAVLLDGDAMAAPQGRAEDVMLALTYRLTPETTVRAGYRIVEGGTDNDKVYNFALINYGLLGAEYRF